MNPDFYNCQSLSADTLVKTGVGRLWKVLVTSSGGGKLKLWDAVSATGTVLMDEMPVSAGDEIELRTEFKTGLYFDVTAGSLTASVIYI